MQLLKHRRGINGTTWLSVEREMERERERETKRNFVTGRDAGEWKHEFVLPLVIRGFKESARFKIIINTCVSRDQLDRTIKHKT